VRSSTRQGSAASRCAVAWASVRDRRVRGRLRRKPPLRQSPPPCPSRQVWQGRFGAPLHYFRSNDATRACDQLAKFGERLLGVQCRQVLGRFLGDVALRGRKGRFRVERVCAHITLRAPDKPVRLPPERTAMSTPTKTARSGLLPPPRPRPVAGNPGLLPVPSVLRFSLANRGRSPARYRGSATIGVALGTAIGVPGRPFR